MTTLVDIVLGECESIIAQTENVIQSMQDEGFNTFSFFEDEIADIRSSAEQLQTLVVDFSDKELLDEESITLYQNIKYSLDGFEDEYFSFVTADMFNAFEVMRESVNVIRKELTK